MALATNLNIQPYNDDYDPSKDYYKILFQPGVSVQARELNQLQTLFQNQIEKFGDNIFASGTIVSGCNFLFMNNYPYVKIKDQTIDGGTVSPAAYKGMRVKNDTSGLMARVTEYADGFESGDPDLKTLYLYYLNTGYNSNLSTFTAGDSLTVYDGTTIGIEKVVIEEDGGGTDFLNNDEVLAIPAIAVTVLTGTFTVGDHITNGAGANLEIISKDTVTLANSNQTILGLKPRTEDLASVTATANSWTISLNDDLVDTDTSATATVTKIIGAGFQAVIQTNPNGVVVNINVIGKGFGYDALPHITIRSIDNSSGINALNLTPQNFIDKITIATVTDAVGKGCLFGVNEGVIYQKGYFLRVLPQTIIVEKYSITPNDIAVGFTTYESIITSHLDSSLNDPAYTKNNNAPGANRLKLVPKLTLTSTDSALADPTIFPLVEYSYGKPYIQRQQTVYNKIGDKIAEGITDTSGDFFIDPFLIATQADFANDTADQFMITVDPGSAYVSGYKMETHTNYSAEQTVSLRTSQQNNYSMNINYGKYVEINNLGGTFKYNTGDAVSLYTVAKNFIANTALVSSQNTEPQGVSIGTARMRSLQVKTVNPGNPIYKLYLFDVQMNSGKSFADVRSVYYDGTTKGIADVVTQLNPTTTLPQAVLIDPDKSHLIYRVSNTSIKNAANATYAYKTFDSTLTVNTQGYIVKSVAANTTLFYPYTGDLSAEQLLDLYVVPTSVDLIQKANSTGTISASTSTANLVGTATQFLTEYAVGDWVYIYTSGDYNLRQVQRIVNNTLMIVDSNCAFVNTTSDFARVFPKDVPIPFGYRDGLSANVDSNKNVLTINLGGQLTATDPEPVSVGVNINQVNLSHGIKSPVRNAYVKIRLANNTGSTTGPWCIGVPDVFRLKAVYIGDSSVNNSITNYFQNFYIDNNQNIDYYGLSYLYKQPDTPVSLSSDQYLLIKFDYFTSSGAHYFNTTSYISANVEQIIPTDSLSLANLDITSGTVNTWEIPEFMSHGRTEFDLLQCMDFRPLVANTCLPSTNYITAPLNPTETETFNSAEKNFPVPGTEFTSAFLESWAPDLVTVFIDKYGAITVANSHIGSNGSVKSVSTPPDNIKIADILLPPYPAVPATRSIRLTEIMNTGVINQRYPLNRIKNHLITCITIIPQNETHVYTQNDLATIDRRLKNVEYYVSLNQSETGINNLVIPSANDPALARYKFGFFAVTFDKPELLDMNNPQYAASNKNGYMWPNRLDWDVFFGNDFNGMLPYQNELIVTQQNATIGSISDPNAVPICAIDIANTVAYQLIFRNVGDSAGPYSPTEDAVDVVNLTLADAEHMANAISFGPVSDRDYWSTDPTGSAVELFFYAYDNPVKIEIYQGNTLITSTASAVNLTAVDISNLTGSMSNQWFNDQPGLYLKDFVDMGSGFVSYAGKITWAYNGSGGTNMTIRTTNGAGVKNWRWVLSYPIDGSSAGCAPPPPPPTTTPAPTTTPIPGQTTTTRRPTTTTEEPWEPSPINIDLNGCFNDWDSSFEQQILAAAASGATGTITYTITDYAWGGSTSYTGTVDIQQYLNDPYSTSLGQIYNNFNQMYPDHPEITAPADQQLAGTGYIAPGGSTYYSVLSMADQGMMDITVNPDGSITIW